MTINYSSSSTSSESNDEITVRTHPPRLFGRQRPIHAVLGGGKVADILSWEKKTVSTALLIGMTVIWFLFEVVEYNFVTLLCHISISIMLVIFIWFRGAEFLNWNPDQTPKIVLHGPTFREVASTFLVKFNQILWKLLDIACGKDPGLFILAIASLYILSMIGTYFTFLNLLYLTSMTMKGLSNFGANYIGLAKWVFFILPTGCLCMQTLPFLYERLEDEVDYRADRKIRRLKKTFKRFNSRVPDKIPRQPTKEN